MSEHLRGSITSLGARAREQAVRVARRVLLDEGTRIMESAHKRWPKDTGRSREALAVELVSGRATMRLVCRVPYARAIRSAKAKIPVWRRFVVEPAIRAAPRILREIGKDLLSELRRSG